MLFFVLISAHLIAIAEEAPPLNTLISTSEPPKPPSLAPMLKKVMPSIVSISGTRKITAFTIPVIPGQPNVPLPTNQPPEPEEHVSQMIGSGIIVDAAQGYILTNSHVINELHDITVTLADNRNLQAKVVGQDQASDLAVLRVEPDNLTEAKFADSDQVEVGDFVVAIGNPYGLSHTTTFGIVSGISRSDVGRDGYYDFIQTNADINMGNSGGGLVNMRGEVIGVNTMIASSNGGSVGLGFAIPANMARGIMTQLAAHGHVDRGPLGVRAQPLTPTLAKAFKVKTSEGAVIYEVVADTPAAHAGLQIGDVVLAIDGKAVKDSFHLRTLISLIPPGEKRDFTIARNGTLKKISVLMTNPKDKHISGENIFSGLKGGSFANTDPQDPIRGIRVLSIEPESPATVADLLPGDIIVAATIEAIATPDIKALTNAAKKQNDVLLLRVIRDQYAIFVGVNKAKTASK